MAADPLALALSTIATALELSQETQRELLGLNRALRERVESVEEALAALGIRVTGFEAESVIRLDLLEADLATVDARLTDVHQNALKALNLAYPGRNPA